MATLRGIDGASLVANLDDSLKLARDTFGTPQSRARDARQQQLEELRQRSILGALGGIGGGQPGQPLGGQPGAISEGGAVPGVSGPAAGGSPGGGFLGVPPEEQNRLIQRLSILAPEMAKAFQTIVTSQDKRAAAAARVIAVNGARNAETIRRAGNRAAPGQKLQAMRGAVLSIANDKRSRGENTDAEAAMMDMTQEQLEVRLDAIGLGATDAKKLFPERFEDVTDDKGRTVAQRSTVSNRLEDVPDEVSGGGSSGLFSAKTEILADGSTVQAGPAGNVVVRGPNGEAVEGAARLQVLRNAQQAELDQARAGAASKAAGKQAVKQSGQAIERLGTIKTSIANIDEAIKLLDEGAGTGPIRSRLPSIRASSIALDNIQKRMGLDVIGDTTFGALSKGELDLALSTALPTGLKPAALKEWLLEKKAAQQKLAGYLENSAIFLGIPGNTAADWVREQKALREAEEAKKGAGDASGASTGRIRFDAQGNQIQ